MEYNKHNIWVLKELLRSKQPMLILWPVSKAAAGQVYNVVIDRDREAVAGMSDV